MLEVETVETFQNGLANAFAMGTKYYIQFTPLSILKVIPQCSVRFPEVSTIGGVCLLKMTVFSSFHFSAEF